MNNSKLITCDVDKLRCLAYRAAAVGRPILKFWRHPVVEFKGGKIPEGDLIVRM